MVSTVRRVILVTTCLLKKFSVLSQLKAVSIILDCVLLVVRVTSWTATSATVLTATVSARATTRNAQRVNQVFMLTMPFGVSRVTQCVWSSVRMESVRNARQNTTSMNCKDAQFVFQAVPMSKVDVHHAAVHLRSRVEAASSTAATNMTSMGVFSVLAHIL